MRTIPSVLLLSLAACQPGAAVVERAQGDGAAFAEDFTLAYCTRQQECHPNTALVSFEVEGCQAQLIGRQERSAEYCSLDRILAQQCLDALDAHVCDAEASFVELSAPCEEVFFECAFPEPPEA